jgi:Sulfotransferase family
MPDTTVSEQHSTRPDLRRGEQMAGPGYIFVVGLPRTGTTLTRFILNSSKEVGIGGESRFFEGTRRLGFETRQSFRRQLAKIGDMSSEAGAKQVVDYIYSIRKNNFWGKLAKTIDREEFLRRLLETDRSERALLDLAMSFYADGKPLRGEKTPAHIYSVPAIFEWFPNTKIIHTFRDPRAVYISQTQKHNGHSFILPLIFRRIGFVFELYSSLYVMVTWLHAIRLHHEYQRRYPNQYYLLKYEDLVSNPRVALQKLCDFLEIQFTEEMLQQVVVNSSFIPREQVQGFDAQAIDRWRKHMHPIIYRWFNLWCRKYLLEFGYQP